MSFLKKAKNLLTRASLSVPESTDFVHTATPPRYVMPAGYEVKIDKGWLLLHMGLNRKERRQLEAKLRSRNPTETVALPGCRPVTVSLSASKIKDRLKSTPSNVPIRLVTPEIATNFGVPLKRQAQYCYEPEFFELLNASRAVAAERERAVISQVDDLPGIPANTAPILSPSFANV